MILPEVSCALMVAAAHKAGTKCVAARFFVDDRAKLASCGGS
jgi:hypothetical protein